MFCAFIVLAVATAVVVDMFKLLHKRLLVIDEFILFGLTFLLNCYLNVIVLCIMLYYRQLSILPRR